VQILDPVAEFALPVLSTSPRLTSLRGKRVWFLDSQGQAWGKGPPVLNPLFQRWRERMERDHDIVANYLCTDQFVSPYRHGKDKFEEVAKSADAVVNGLACCGGGTSAVVHDAIQYELRGIPTVSLVTDSVLHHAHAAMLKLGMKDLRLLEVSHNVHMFAPVAPPDECARVADGLYDAMLAALLAS
jgi:hypothetical protein